jgi:PAS domain S-box-containing protein
MVRSSKNKCGITERVADLEALEIERKRAEQALRESEKKYRELVNSLPQIVFEMDADGLITFANRKAFDLLGYTQDDIDKGLNALEMIIPQDRNRAMENIQRGLNGEEATNCGYTIFRKDGSIISVVIHINPIIGKNRFACFRGIMIDISDRKQAEEEKKKLEVQLHQAQKMESIGTLAGGIAHEFNNVLSPIIGYTELTMDDVTEGSLAKKNLQHVLKAALRAKDMVQQILAFSRKADIEKKPIKVQTVVKDALKMLRTSIPSTIEIHQNINADGRENRF